MRTFGGIVVLMLVLTGCTGGDGGTDDKPSALKRDTTAIKPVWTADLAPIGQPVVTGTTAVVISKVSGERLEIVGVDATSGKVRWRYPVGPNNVPNGIALIPQLTKAASGEQRVVFFLAPQEPRQDREGDRLVRMPEQRRLVQVRRAVHERRREVRRSRRYRAGRTVRS